MLLGAEGEDNRNIIPLPLLDAASAAFPLPDENLCPGDKNLTHYIECIQLQSMSSLKKSQNLKGVENPLTLALAACNTTTEKAMSIFMSI